MLTTSGADPIYLDGFATMPLAPEARAAMFSAFDHVGNAGSSHSAGEMAAQHVSQARSAVAEMINALPSEITFTAGATEANNLGVIGVALAAMNSGNKRRRIIVSAIEHKAVLEPAKHLKALGFDVVVAPVKPSGVIDLGALSAVVDADTLLVSVMAVNNETGIIQPVIAIAELVHAAGGLLHCDAAQAVGKIECDVEVLNVDYLSISSHKCYGPMGVGALYCAAHALKPTAMTFGGGQESGLRSGTEPVALIAGFGAALAAASERMPYDAARGAALLSRVLNGLKDRQVRFEVVGGELARVPGGAAIAVDGADAETVCTILARRVHVSSGSACTAGQLRTSHVLEAMGFSDRKAQSVLRLMVHRYLQPEEADEAASALADAIQRSLLAAGEVRQ